MGEYFALGEIQFLQRSVLRPARDYVSGSSTVEGETPSKMIATIKMTQGLQD
jgi:hypothetical protein